VSEADLNELRVVCDVNPEASDDYRITEADDLTMGVLRRILAALRQPVVPVGVSREVDLNELLTWIDAMTEKHGNPVGTDYEQGVNDQGFRIRGKVAAILAALRPTDTGWRDIATAPKDGTEFQGWTGQWEPRCRFNPETEAFETWGRVDYDENGWEVSDVATRWMLLPPAPTDTGRE
jgi:hypothetical protein